VDFIKKQNKTKKLQNYDKPGRIPSATLELGGIFFLLGTPLGYLALNLNPLRDPCGNRMHLRGVNKNKGFE
jgi:hypothetical protein